MKIERVIQLAGLMERGNVLPEELAIEFLSEFDGMIQSDIMLHAPEEIVRYDSKDQELILRPPHDGLYLSFLVAMIRQCQGEFEGYNNAQEIVEDKLKTFRRWYIHHYRPADTNSRSYTGGTSGDGFGFAYLSAYGLAVKHGYQGTEEEWLQSLKGEKGDAGAAARMRYDAERDMVQWGVGEEWHDLYTMAQVLAPLYEKLDEMTARAETAAGEAAGHAAAAQTAREQAVNVLHDAEGHAREALYQANNAKAAAQVAKQAGADAEAAIEAAQEARQSAAASEASAGLAEQAARRSDVDAQAAVRAAEEAGNSAADATAQAGAAADSAFQAEGSAQAANQAYVEAERMTTRAETARTAAQTAAEEARTAAEEAKNAAGTGGGGGYVASDEPPENTKALWVDTAEPEEAVALGVTAVETAEGAELYCTDELGTTTVTVRNGKDGAQGPAGPQGAPGDDYVLTDEDRQEIAGIAAGMVPGGGGGFSLPLLYELTTTEEVRWIDTGDSAFQAKNILIISLLSKATETNKADYAMDGSFHTEEERANYPWSNLAVARGVASGLSKQYNRLFSAIGFRGDGGGWIFVHNIRNEVNSSAVQSFAQTGSYGRPALRVPITGMIIGDAKAATDTTRVFGVGTTLQIWGC